MATCEGDEALARFLAEEEKQQHKKRQDLADADFALAVQLSAKAEKNRMQDDSLAIALQLEQEREAASARSARKAEEDMGARLASQLMKQEALGARRLPAQPVLQGSLLNVRQPAPVPAGMIQIGIPVSQTPVVVGIPVGEPVSSHAKKKQQLRPPAPAPQLTKEDSPPIRSPPKLKRTVSLSTEDMFKEDEFRARDLLKG